MSGSMRFATSPLSFNYDVRVDYNASNNADFNHTDFTIAPAIENGKWHRYVIPDAPAFVWTKEGSSGVTPTLVPDGVSALESNGPGGCTSTGCTYPGQRKALLYESTFLVPNGVTLNKLCFAATGMNGMHVRIDGELVQKVSSNHECHE